MSKVWMFHYVKPDNHDFPYLNYFSLDDFREFLDTNLKFLKLVSPQEYIDLVSQGKNIPENAQLMSFDDGLQDHYQWVFPELKKRGLSGFFFLNTLPFQNGKLLPIHKIHLLSGIKGYKWLSEFFLEYSVNIQNISEYLQNTPQALLAYPYDTPDTAYFKYSLNYIFPRSLRDQILEWIFTEHFGGSSLSENFYLNYSNLREMVAEGMVFGYHGHSHTPFSKLDDLTLGMEITTSDNLLSKYLRTPLECISYPYGDESSIHMGNLEVLRKHCVKLGFVAEESQHKDPLLHSRIDCTEYINARK
jgi:peptidoglycan/xylan/chitin deacetylase (PgdA/CDA1 family)